MSKKVIILIHGLYSAPWMMLSLKALFLKNGFICETFKHKSVAYSEKTIQDLNLLVDTAKSRHAVPKVILFGHSMGGLISKKYATSFPENVSHVITAGTPHNESVIGHVANLMNLLGSAGQSGITKKEHLEWPMDIPFLNIIGTLGFGPVLYAKTKAGKKSVSSIILKQHKIDAIDKLKKVDALLSSIVHKVHRIGEPSDGTVFVSEALCSDATKQIYIKASHFGLLLSKKVVDESVAFISLTEHSHQNSATRQI